MTVYQMAAAYANETKIIDLPFGDDKVNKDSNAQKRNALHIAVMVSNETTVNHLLKNFHLDPNARDKDGLTPLYWAAQHTDSTNIIDLLVAAKKTQPNDRGNYDFDFHKEERLSTTPPLALTRRPLAP